MCMNAVIGDVSPAYWRDCRRTQRRLRVQQELTQEEGSRCAVQRNLRQRLRFGRRIRHPEEWTSVRNQLEVTSELRTLFLKHVVVNHLSCRAIHGMHRLGRNPEEGLAISKPVECSRLRSANQVIEYVIVEVAADGEAPTTSLVQGGDWCKL